METTSPMSPAEEPLALAWRDLVVTAVAAKRELLHKLSGSVKGRFLAIMGASGGGKTTLLNALALRSDQGVSITGEAFLNGNPYTNAELKRLTGYVMQDDQLNEKLSVEETLQFTAALRLSPTFTAEMRQLRVEEVLAQMNLVSCRALRVGDRHHKGIPGGERKRLCTAIELITRPKLIFLDEPTTSLDSHAALTLCVTLQKLAHSGTCTVVCTIHQPQSKIFALFDDLLLLSHGRIVFHGPADRAVEAFTKGGFPLPPFTNPADHLLDVVVKHPDVEIPSLETSPGIGSPSAPVEVQPLNIDWSRIGWVRQFCILLWRTVLETVRGWPIIAVQVVTTLITATLIGTAFLQLGTSQGSAVKRKAVLFFCAVNQGLFASMQVINSFPAERVLVLRERAAGTYYVSAYLMAKTVVSMAQQVIGPLVFSCTVYWLVGLQARPDNFFLFFFMMVLATWTCTSLALAISTICRTTTFSLTVLPFVLEIFRLFGGFFLSPANLPAYFSWLDALSVNKYTYVGVSLVEFTGLQLYCTPEDLKANNNTCPIPNGEVQIQDLGLNQLSVGLCVMALLVMIVGYRVIAYLGLRIVKW